MMSDIPLLLQRGWENIWKEKILWLFGGLILLGPLTDFIPIPNSAGLLLSCLKLAKSFISISIQVVSYTSLVYVSFCVIHGVHLNIRDIFAVTKRFFWVVFFSFFTITLFLVPFFCLVFLFSFKQPAQTIAFAHNSFIISIPLAIFAAIQYFLIAEIITSETLVWEGLKNSWAIFSNHFVVLASIGIILGIVWHVSNIIIGTALRLTQHNFDFSAVSKLDLLSPRLSFSKGNLYEFVIAFVQVPWQIYSASIFVLAYTKYKGVKKNSSKVLK